MASIRDAKTVTETGTPEEEFSPSYRTPIAVKTLARGGGVEARGKTKGTMVKMAKGGMTRGDGCCQRGHTKGKVM